MTEIGWRLILWLLGGLARAIGRADTERRVHEANKRYWQRVEMKRRL